MTRLYLSLPKRATAFAGWPSMTVFAVKHYHHDHDHEPSPPPSFTNVRMISLHRTTPTYVCLQSPPTPSKLTKRATAANHFDSCPSFSTAANCFQQPRTVQRHSFMSMRTPFNAKVVRMPYILQNLCSHWLNEHQTPTIVEGQRPPHSRPWCQVSLLSTTTTAITD